jgi:hypothetical protein
MQKLNPFVVSDGSVQFVADEDLPAFHQEAQQAGKTVEPAQAFVDSKGTLLPPVADGDVSAFKVEAESKGIEHQPVRYVSLNGQMVPVADSDRAAFIKEYQTATPGSPMGKDRAAVQARASTSADEQQRAMLAGVQDQIQKQVDGSAPKPATSTVGKVADVGRDFLAGAWNAVAHAWPQDVADAMRMLPGAAGRAGVAMSAATKEQAQDDTLSRQKGKGAASDVATGAGGLAAGIGMMAGGPVGWLPMAAGVTATGQRTFDNLVAMGKDKGTARRWAAAQMAVEAIPMLIAARVGAGKEAQDLSARALAKMTTQQKMDAGNKLFAHIVREAGTWTAAGAVQQGGGAEVRRLSGEQPDANVALETVRGAIGGLAGSLGFAGMRGLKTVRAVRQGKAEYRAAGDAAEVASGAAAARAGASVGPGRGEDGGGSPEAPTGPRDIMAEAVPHEGYTATREQAIDFLVKRGMKRADAEAQIAARRAVPADDTQGAGHAADVLGTVPPEAAEGMVNEAAGEGAARRDTAGAESSPMPAIPPAAVHGPAIRVVAPAIRTPDGRAVTGADHPSIIAETMPHLAEADAAAAQGADGVMGGNVDAVRYGPNAGFTVEDASGNQRFATREEAMAVAKQAGQVKPEFSNEAELHSHMVKTQAAPAGEIPERPSIGGVFGTLKPFMDFTTGIQNAQTAAVAAGAQRAFNWFARRNDRGSMNREISGEQDAGNTRAVIEGAQHAHTAENALVRGVGGKAKSTGSLERIGLTAYVEHEGDVSLMSAAMVRLQKVIDTSPSSAVRKWSRKMQEGLRFAIENAPRMADAARAYRAETDRQLRSVENANGVNTEYRKNYVYHIQEREAAIDDAAESGGGVSGNFTRQRTGGDTFVDSLENGHVPKSLDAIDLLQQRISRGKMIVNRKLWNESLDRMIDPVTGKTIGASEVPRMQVGPDGKPVSAGVMEAPPGYTTVNVGGTKKFKTVLNPYVGLYKALTGESFFNDTLMQVVSGTKHTTLLFDTFHLGRLAFWSTVYTGSPLSFRKGVLAMDYTPEELRNMAAHGEIPADRLADVLEDHAVIKLLVDRHFNIGSIADNMHTEFLKNVPLLGQYNKFLFTTYQRGAMAQAGKIWFNLIRKANPDMPAEAIADRVVHDLNTRFASFGSQGVLKSKTANDLARIFFLAPHWNLGLVQSEFGAYKQIAKGAYNLVAKGPTPENARRIVAAPLAVGTAGLALAGFAANQLLNYVFRGHPTWDNPEEGPDAKISAWVPDVIGGGPGMMLSPLAIPTEIGHQVLDQMQRTGRLDAAARDVLLNKLQPQSRAAWLALTQKDQFGRATQGTWDTIKKVAVAAMPMPIGAKVLYQGVNDVVTGQHNELFPGQFEKQMLASMGIKSIGAPSAQQRMMNLARDWKIANKVPIKEFGEGTYSDVLRYVNLGNKPEAIAALDKMLQTPGVTPTTVMNWARGYAGGHLFTGKKEYEQRFVASLTSEQRHSYQNALVERRESAVKVAGFLRDYAEAKRTEAAHK